MMPCSGLTPCSRFGPLLAGSIEPGNATSLMCISPLSQRGGTLRDVCDNGMKCCGTTLRVNSDRLRPWWHRYLPTAAALFMVEMPCAIPVFGRRIGLKLLDPPGQRHRRSVAGDRLQCSFKSPARVVPAACAVGGKSVGIMGAQGQ